MGLFRSFSNGMPESLAKEGCISVQKMGNAPDGYSGCRFSLTLSILNGLLSILHDLFFPKTIK